VISPSQISLLDTTQHSQQTNSHGAGWIRTRNPSKLAAANPLLRSRGQWDQGTWS